MTNWAVGGALALILTIWLVATNVRAGSLPVDNPVALARTQSVGRLIQDTTLHPVHIIFVHGMRAEGIGTAQTFMAGLCKYGPITCAKSSDFQRVDRFPLPIGDWPQKATLLGAPIWETPTDWAASQPFVDRYVFPQAKGRPPIIVDEVNWWPLLFPLKCRALVAPEAQLSGVDKAHLDLCMRSASPYHPWMTQAQYDNALKGPLISGGGALANRYLKQQIMNWGLSDAVIALGPMRRLFRRTMESAFGYAATYDGQDDPDQVFVVVSESLGSFVVLDAAANIHGDSPKAQTVINRASDLYFFANQFPLLELGRIKGLAVPPTDAHAEQDILAQAVEELSPGDLLKRWAAPVPGLIASPRPKQIIAFNDPSDMLTFDVPPILNADASDAAIVVNVYDRNEFNWLGLIVDPVQAHTGHSSNAKVLKMMFTP